MTDRIRIGFYGAGRVGCTLGRYFREHGLSVMGYYNRTRERAEEAAGWTGAAVYESVHSLLTECDAIFLTVSDQAISSVVKELADTESLSGKIYGATYLSDDAEPAPVDYYDCTALERYSDE